MTYYDKEFNRRRYLVFKRLREMFEDDYQEFMTCHPSKHAFYGYLDLVEYRYEEYSKLYEAEFGRPPKRRK